jgi:hypothetical protein
MRTIIGTRRNLISACKMALVAAVLALAGTAARAQDDSVIEPGVRLGPVHLGITDVELYRLLGDPKSTRTNGSISMNYIYSKFQVSVDTDTHRVIQVTTDDPAYSTAEGIRVGSSGLAVAAKLGTPPGPCDGGCNYTYPNGLALGINADGSVRAIWVFTPG